LTASLENKEITLYLDWLSQPSRAVASFLKLNHIPFTAHEVSILKGEQKTAEFLKVNPLGQIPAIKEGDLTLGESHTILRYLADSRKTADHWFPSDVVKRAYVNQYLDWHHSNLRFGAAGLIYLKVIAPILGQPSSEVDIKRFEIKLEASFERIESWLTQHKYIAGEEISIADLSAACEIVMLIFLQYDFSKYPKTHAWLRAVNDIPEVLDAHKIFWAFVRTKNPDAKV